MDTTQIQIAIDGPSGAGKSSAAKILSKKLGILYLNTGAMYRAFTYHALKNGKYKPLGQNDTDELFAAFDLNFDGDNVFLNGEDISDVIRTVEIDKKVSDYASDPYVRKKMVALQKQIAQGRGIVMEGRDICSVVLPDAPYKFYIDASVDVRAKRRYDEDLKKGLNVSYEEIRNDIIRRDEVDSGREADPLKISQDAVFIDSSEYTLDGVTDMIINIIKTKEKNYV